MGILTEIAITETKQIFSRFGFYQKGSTSLDDEQRTCMKTLLGYKPNHNIFSWPIKGKAKRK